MHKFGLNAKFNKAFTIVELLVVIVVIGILASITMISYTGMTSKANVAMLQSDLRNAMTQLEIDKVYNSVYPINANDSNNGMGLKTSPGTIFEYEYSGGDYCLKASNRGVSYYVMSSERVVTPGSCPVVRNLSAGYMQTCSINTLSNLYCWGWNGTGALGDGSVITRSSPTAVNTTGVLSGLKIKAVSAGFYHTCVIASDDNAYCWGQNGFGELGNNTTADSLIPVAVNRTGLLNGLKIKSITAGYRYTCAIASDNNAYCWGYNASGQLGNNTNTVNPNALPVMVDRNGVLSGLTVKSISAGYNHVCVVASNNKAYCWGDNSYGAIGNNGSGSISVIPTTVDMNGELAGMTIISVVAGGRYTCAIASNNKAYCWGREQYGVLGNGELNNTNQLNPTAVISDGVLNNLTIKYISVVSNDSSQNHTCAIASNNKAYCWGFNGSGELGDNTITNSAVPIEVNSAGVLNGISLKSIEVNGQGGTCALGANSRVYCWGNGVEGELGRGSLISSRIPVEANSF